MQGLFDYRNALYYGRMQQKKPEGVGITITDEGEVLLAKQKHNVIDGQYFYAGDGIKIYGTMRNGQYDGFNLFHLKEFTAYCSFDNGSLQDMVVLFRNGRLVGRQPNQRVHAIPSHPALNDFIEQIINQSNCFNILRVNYNRTFYGIVGEKGIGFEILSEELFSLGMYSEGQLSGIGKLILPNEIQQGIFKEGHLYSVGMKWNSAKQTYYFADWKKSGLTVLSRGKDKYPWEEVRKIRREFHLRAVNFVNDWMSVGKMFDLQHLWDEVSRMQPLQVSVQFEVEIAEDQEMTGLAKTPKSPSVPETPMVLILDDAIANPIEQSQVRLVTTLQDIPKEPDDLLSAIKEYQRLSSLKRLRR